jgi:hypothetical protein
MPTATDHLAYIAEHFGDVGSLARFAARMTVMRNGSDLVFELGGRQLRIRASDQVLVIGSEEVALGDDAAATLKSLAPVLALRLSQMDAGSA